MRFSRVLSFEDARETKDFPLIRARVEWHENKAAEWLLKAIDRKKKGYDVGSRAHRRSYRRAALAAKRNAATARLLENIIEGLSK